MATPNNHKLDGEEAELQFMLRALQKGFAVCKPFGDSAAYDVVVEAHGHFFRVQVKSTNVENTRYRRFNVNTKKSSNRHYDASDADFLAAYVKPYDTWFIIPVAIIEGTKTIHLRPHADTISKYNEYEEAWHLFTND